MGSAGNLKDLTLPQRERVLSYLLDKLNLLEGSGNVLLGAACPTTPSQQTLQLPPIASKPPGTGVPPPPGLPARPAGALAGFGWNCAVPKRPASTPGLMVSTGVQTADPELQNAEELLAQVLPLTLLHCYRCCPLHKLQLRDCIRRV